MAAGVQRRHRRVCARASGGTPRRGRARRVVVQRAGRGTGPEERAVRAVANRARVTGAARGAASVVGLLCTINRDRRAANGPLSINMRDVKPPNSMVGNCTGVCRVGG